MRAAFLLLLAAFTITGFVSGCGSDSTRNDVITIRDFSFDPGQTTVTAGTTVRWFNGGNITHNIVSGTLQATSNPKVVDVGISNSGFTPDDITINLGDTVRFRNLTNLPRQVEVKNQDFDMVFLSPQLDRDDTALFTPDTAGVYDVRDALSPTLLMRITVVGIPNPNGLFQSGVLRPGDEFSFTFNTPGTFPFFCTTHKIEQGAVVVEP